MTFYLTVIRKIDDLSVTVADIPLVGVFDQGRLSIDGQGSLAFTNSGTRTVAVLELSILITQKRSGAGTGCNTVDTTVFSTDLEPLVVKAGEIALKKFKIKYMPERDRARVGEKVLFPVRKEVMVESGVVIQICLLFNLATASKAGQVAEIDYGDYSIDKRQLYMSHDRHIDLSKPFPLVHEQWPLVNW